MNSLRDIYFKVCNALIISVLTLKIGLFIVVIISNHTTLTINDLASPWSNSSQAHYYDLFSDSAILYSPVLVEYGDKSPLYFPVRRNTVNKDIVYSQEKTINQFFPEPSICSHTGIYMCLRL